MKKLAVVEFWANMRFKSVSPAPRGKSLEMNDPDPGPKPIVGGYILSWYDSMKYTPRIPWPSRLVSPGWISTYTNELCFSTGTSCVCKSITNRKLGQWHRAQQIEPLRVWLNLDSHRYQCARQSTRSKSRTCDRIGSIFDTCILTGRRTLQNRACYPQIRTVEVDREDSRHWSIDAVKIVKNARTFLYRQGLWRFEPRPQYRRSS